MWSAKCEIQKANEYCIKLLNYGIHENDRIWLTMLATTRETIIVPTTNCLGHLNNVREDAGILINHNIYIYIICIHKILNHIASFQIYIFHLL